MPTSTIQNDPIVNFGMLYINGLMVSLDPVTPNTKLNISAGMCRDANNVMDITLGVSNPNIEGIIVTAPLVLDATINGVNGLDTGSLAANTFYSIYMIDDSRYYKRTACILSLSSNALPLLPTGYDSYRLIGYWAVNASTHFYAGYMSGVGHDRSFAYDAMVFLTTINSTSYAAFYFNTVCPSVFGTIATIFVDFSAAAAANLFSGAVNGVVAGPTYRLIAPVAAGVSVTTGQFNVTVLSNLAAGASAKVSAGTANVALVGYQFYI